MRVDLENAYVLHSRAFKDTSLLVDFFTEDYGRITLIAKGARKQKKKSNFLLQPFTDLAISWQGKGQLKTLTSTEITTFTTSAMLVDSSENSSLSLNSNLEGKYLYSGFYANELLTYLLPFDETNQGVFHLYVNLLATLKRKADLEKCLRIFEFSLLSELGYGIDFVYSGLSSELIDENKKYYYKLDEGFIKVDAVDNESKYNPSEYGCVLDGFVIKKIYNKNYSDKLVRQSAKYIARKAIDHLLVGKKVKSRELFS